MIAEKNSNLVTLVTKSSRKIVPEEICPSPNSNANPKPNPDPDRGGQFAGHRYKNNNVIITISRYI